MTKGHSMAGWRVGFVVGNAEMVAALAKLKSYLDYGTFQPIQIASIIALNEGDEYVTEVNDTYTRRRDVLTQLVNFWHGRLKAENGKSLKSLLKKTGLKTS